MNSQLAPLFDHCHQENRAALIGYLPTGYPDLPGSITAMKALIRSGCDLIEVGIPYSDPGMDGPMIAQATRTALNNGTKIRDTLAAIEAISAAGGRAVVMSYWNPLLQYGIDNFSRDLANAGGLGIITPDLIVDEAHEWIQASDTHHLDRIFLVAPSSTPHRLALTAYACTGFVYAASTMGVTGNQHDLSTTAPQLVSRIRQVCTTPIGVGLGVSNAQQAQAIASYADAVIVGSAIVTALTESLRTLEELVEQLARGVRCKDQHPCTG